MYAQTSHEQRDFKYNKICMQNSIKWKFATVYLFCIRQNMLSIPGSLICSTHYSLFDYVETIDYIDDYMPTPIF